MGYIPGWWTGWCESQGLNPHRPALWPDAARAAFMVEKLRRFRLHWAWMSSLDQPAIIRQQSGRAELIRQVRRELEDALSEVPESMGRHDHQSPHRQYRTTRAMRETETLAAYEVRTYPDGSREIILPPRPSLAERKQAALPPWWQIPVEEVLTWVEAKPERIGLSETTARCLYWLEKEFSGKVPA